MERAKKSGNMGDGGDTKKGRRIADSRPGNAYSCAIWRTNSVPSL